MVIDASEKFLERYANTVLQATKKDGPIAAATRMKHLPVETRLDIRRKVLQLKKSP